MSDFLHILENLRDNPLILGLALAVFTLVLEDAATVSGATFAAAGNITVWWSLGALYVGIILGDAGLYLFGKFASANRWAKRFLKKRSVDLTKNRLKNNMFPIVFAARFIPGMRLTVYSTCGFFGLPFTTFILATACASCLWTTGLFFTTYFLGTQMLEEWGNWRWLVSAGIVLLVIIVPRLFLKKQISTSLQ